ncbi:MAG: RdgB/HAM1 family non-canonical purine NTP pyrophosphatase [Bacteroidales bacterium]|nr:RdgB/HAM1 family non-canonical purine NTP pyrophosphatase [Bacteroidales bacterium]
MKIYFATGNSGKLREAREILGPSFEVLSPLDAGVEGEAEETGATFIENSLLKAQFLFDRLGESCFADDSGLEVDALGGAPGIYSARYASDHNFADNIDRLLSELEKIYGTSDSEETFPGAARFRCVTTLILPDGVPHYFEGTVEGRIARRRHGDGGFGYDPVFVPDAFPCKTIAELPEDVKNGISHRGVALRKMADWLDLIQR